jgi:MFS transporter, ACS family, hexuronate transporter
MMPSSLGSVLAGVRWRILFLLFLVTVINFVDRQSLSVVAPLLRDSLHLSNQDYGLIVAFFSFGMLSGEFPMGWLMDRKGPRFGLSFAVVWWSIANCLHAFGASRLHFAALRFWLGTGECGNYSGGVKVISQWFPAKERAFAIGVFNGGSMIGSIVALPLVGWLTLQFGWPSAFLIPGSLGFLWVIAWWREYHDPARHPAIGEEERRYILDGRDAAVEPEAPASTLLLRHRQTWAIMLCRMLVGPVVQFYIFWMPEYLFRVRGMSLKSISYFGWLPFLFGDIGSMLGGAAAGYLLVRGFSVVRSRGLTMAFGALCCAGSIVVVLAPDANLAIAAICFVLFGHTFLSANMFAVVSDLFPASAVGRVTALTGIAQGLTGMVFQYATGAIVDQYSFVPVFAMAALLPALGCALLFAVSGGLKPIPVPVSEAPLLE